MLYYIVYYENSAFPLILLMSLILNLLHFILPQIACREQCSDLTLFLFVFHPMS